MARGRKIQGITIEIGGETKKLQNSLKDVNRDISSTQTQLRDVEKLLKLDPKNTELLAQKHKLLGQAVNETKEKLNQLKQANEQVSESAKNYDAWKAKYDPIQKEIGETQTELTKLKEKAADADQQLSEGKISQSKYDHIQSEVKETESRLKELKQQAKEVDDEFGHPISPEKYDALQREIIETTEDLKKLEKQEAVSSEKMQSMTATGSKLKEIGGAMTDVGKTMTTHVTLPIAAAGVAVTKVASDFDTAMSQVAASMGTTVDQIPKIREEAKKLGETTAFSATEAAEGFNILAQAGLTEEQQLDAIGPTLDLAAAGHIDLANAASYVTGTVMDSEMKWVMPLSMQIKSLLVLQLQRRM